MAYITSEQVKDMRNQIKKAFPAKDGWKWSVTKEHHSSVTAALMQFPSNYDFAIKREGNDTSDELYTQLNHYYLDTCGLGKKEIAVLKKVNDILHTGHWDESDSMTDYFHCSHYVSLHIGKWDRPAVKAAPKSSHKNENPAPKSATYTAAEYERVAEFVGIQF